MSEVSMVRRRRLASPVLPVPAPASPLEDDDLLLEILLLLPPQPSSLLRASLVCKRWRCLVSDPDFLRRFRAHHRKPPLLGFFSFDGDADCPFTPWLDPPNRIPAGRFSLPHRRGESLVLVDCRHGLCVLLNKKQPEAVVWNPISGQQCRVAVPEEFYGILLGDDVYAAVLCAAGDDDHDHVHGDCNLSSFIKLALVCRGDGYRSPVACLYKSRSAVWGNIISKTITDGLSGWRKQGVLVGNAFCWLLCGEPHGDILQFDLDMQKLVVIEKPVHQHTGYCSSQITRTEEGSLGLIVLTELSMRLWERKVNSDDVGRLVLQKTIELGNHLSPRAPIKDTSTWTLIQGYDEDQNVIFLRMSIGLFMIQLDSMQFKEIHGTHFMTTYFPYTSYYAADWAASGRDAGPGMSRSTWPDYPI